MPPTPPAIVLVDSVRVDGGVGGPCTTTTPHDPRFTCVEPVGASTRQRDFKRQNVWIAACARARAEEVVGARARTEEVACARANIQKIRIKKKNRKYDWGLIFFCMLDSRRVLAPATEKK